MNELLHAALSYLPRTLPLIPGTKRPAVEGWPDWPATAESVRAWWGKHPEANVGVRTGGGLTVVDVDLRHGGHLQLAELEREHGQLPPTPEVVTGSGGRHIYFRAPRTLCSVELAPGVEIKADGRQVVGPPSRHPNGRLYVWHPAHPFIEREIAALPAWVVRLAGVERHSERSDFADLAELDPLHRIPASVYVPTLTGRSIDRRGYVRCPFHSAGGERTPSLRIYDHGWKCYGCGLAGAIYQLAGLLGGWTLPLSSPDRRAIRATLLDVFGAVLT
jgi:Bifunctional DNA primase/polymerase, N-terminal